MTKTTPIRQRGSAAGNFTAPGLSLETGHRIAEVLQGRLHALNEFQLVLKHAHWNVVGPGFIAVHEMLDPQVDLVRDQVDDVAERMATLGVAPNGLPGALVTTRNGSDYPVLRADVQTHLEALDAVFAAIIADNREAIAAVGDDVITEDLLVSQTRELEKQHWFVRAHLENAAGELAGTARARQSA